MLFMSLRFPGQVSSFIFPAVMDSPAIKPVSSYQYFQVLGNPADKYSLSIYCLCCRCRFDSNWRVMVPVASAFMPFSCTSFLWVIF